MTDVTVEVEESPQVEATPAVTIVDTGSADSVPTYVLELTERLVTLEHRVTALEGTAYAALSTAEGAQSSAEVAGQIAIDAIETAETANELANEVLEVAVTTAEETGVAEIVAEETSGDLIPDVVPQKTHWLFRDREEWKREIAS